MAGRPLLAALLLALVLAWVPRGAAPGDEPVAAGGDAGRVLRVAVVPAPPFAMRSEAGGWEGIAVELWRHIATDLDLRYELGEVSIPEAIAGIETGILDVVLTATASADREMRMDFTHPYTSSGLGIAVPVSRGGGGWLDPLVSVFSGGTLRLILVLFGSVLAAAVLIWVCERRANPEHFGSGPGRGISDGLWWAAVTLTTVGYGDKAPKTAAGRIIAVVWMLTAIVLIALFTAQVTSSLTVASLGGRVRGPADLPHVRVGSIEASQQQTLLLRDFGVRAKGYPGFAAGLDALDGGDIDAFVALEPVLRYEIGSRYAGRLAVIPIPFLRADYVFALPLDSPLRKPINRSLLAFIASDPWKAVLQQYLGS